MPAIYGHGYRLLASALGRALAYSSDPAELEQYIDLLIVKLREDNSRFDEGRFRRAIEAVRLSEVESRERG